MVSQRSMWSTSSTPQEQATKAAGEAAEILAEQKVRGRFVSAFSAHGRGGGFHGPMDD